MVQIQHLRFWDNPSSSSAASSSIIQTPIRVTILDSQANTHFYNKTNYKWFLGFSNSEITHHHHPSSIIHYPNPNQGGLSAGKGRSKVVCPWEGAVVRYPSPHTCLVMLMTSDLTISPLSENTCHSVSAFVWCFLLVYLVFLAFARTFKHWEEPRGRWIENRCLLCWFHFQNRSIAGIQVWQVPRQMWISHRAPNISTGGTAHRPVRVDTRVMSPPSAIVMVHGHLEEFALVCVACGCGGPTEF